MHCKEVEAVLAKEGVVPVPLAARPHLASCGSCQGLVADLTSIVATAHLLPQEIEPPAHIWPVLRAQLEREGIIKTPSAQARWREGFSELFRGRVLATSAVGLLVLFAVFLQTRRSATPAIARNVIAVSVPRDIYSDTSVALRSDEALLPAAQSSGPSVVDASLRQNLQIVNQFIADCERRAKEQPQDDLTRDYLSGAYEQKAQLLSVMMERAESGR